MVSEKFAGIGVGVGPSISIGNEPTLQFDNPIYDLDKEKISNVNANIIERIIFAFVSLKKFFIYLYYGGDYIGQSIAEIASTLK